MQHPAANSQLVYVVDDDLSITRLIALELTARGYQAQVFHSGHEALANLENDRPDLVLLDLVMPDCDGLEIARLIRQRSFVPIIVLSVRSDTASKLAALDLGRTITSPNRFEWKSCSPAFGPSSGGPPKLKSLWAIASPPIAPVA